MLYSIINRAQKSLLGGAFLVFAILLGSSSFAVAEEELRNIAGDWGCSFITAPQSNNPNYIDHVAGVIQLKVDDAGFFTGTQAIAVANPHLFQLGVPIRGDFAVQDDGMYLLTTHIDLGGGEDTTEGICVSMDRNSKEGKYNELRCVDITDEDMEGGVDNSLSTITCKRR
jgi:hypothetical protein